MLDWHSCQICYPFEIKFLLLLLLISLSQLEILDEEVYDNQNNHKPNNRNRRADEALVDRVNHANGIRGNLNSSIK